MPLNTPGLQGIIPLASIFKFHIILWSQNADKWLQNYPVYIKTALNWKKTCNNLFTHNNSFGDSKKCVDIISPFTLHVIKEYKHSLRRAHYEDTVKTKHYLPHCQTQVSHLTHLPGDHPREDMTHIAIASNLNTPRANNHSSRMHAFSLWINNKVGMWRRLEESAEQSLACLLIDYLMTL